MNDILTKPLTIESFAEYPDKMDSVNKCKLTHLNIILNVMCQAAGVNYNDIDMKEDDWYFKHSWDEESEKAFISWMADYVHKIKPAQRELYDRSYMRKKDCVMAARMWVLNYGWKTK